MIHADCEVYENENGEIGVLTREGFFGYAGDFWGDENLSLVEDYNMNLDKRVIEFYLQKPNRHTYNEWNLFLKTLDYLLLDDYEEDDAEYYSPVDDFKLTFIPKGSFFRIISEEKRSSYGDYLGIYQKVEIFRPEEFMDLYGVFKDV